MKLKEWLTVEEAARHLSAIASEPVSEADILRLALDGHLTLSVRFVNHAHARVGPVVPVEQAKKFDVPSLDGNGTVTIIDGVQLAGGVVVQTYDAIVTLNGVWDLTMLGAEALDVEHRYQFLTGGPRVELVCLGGPIVRRGETYAQIQESFSDNEFFDKSKLHEPYDDPRNWYPAPALPGDAVYVVTVTALDELRHRLGVVEPSAAHPDPSPQRAGRSGGRPMAATWPLWVAELVALIHEQGIPPGDGADGVEQLIDDVADHLAKRSVEGPSRATVQATARAALVRLRGAGN